VITDPPYPCIKRNYGTLTEKDWHTLMADVVTQVRRVLKPAGSAVFILQPNSRKVGKMRTWIWEFLLKTAKEWNLIQDAYWWNTSAAPVTAANRKNKLLRPSVKYCLWFGDPNCYRNQDAVLWQASQDMLKRKIEDRALRHRPSGYTFRDGRALATVLERGGTTPFNLLPISASRTKQDMGVEKHPARTPYRVAEWWVKYICPPGGVVLDPFAGSATIGLAALRNGNNYVGIEQNAKYFQMARERLAGELAQAA